MKLNNSAGTPRSLVAARKGIFTLLWTQEAKTVSIYQFVGSIYNKDQLKFPCIH